MVTKNSRQVVCVPVGNRFEGKGEGHRVSDLLHMGTSVQHPVQVNHQDIRG